MRVCWAKSIWERWHGAPGKRHEPLVSARKGPESRHRYALSARKPPRLATDDDWGQARAVLSAIRPNRWRWQMNPDDFPAPRVGFVITNFLVVSDQDRSRDFYQSIFDGQVLVERDPVILKVANTWLILNTGGGPTDDKPTVTLTTPPDPNRASAFLNVRVADIAKAYKEWSAKG